ncbi:cytosolic protein [Shouchella sp. JSM 1781072]|uniref:cytosolic protein n=1 Tax=Bacillaceae TaxID=186817 RepID=UPI000C07028D|nr:MULTISPECIES: cytosolic protein [Bacillaceae]UTR07693.1 cytosolic protein [Alkalihalobacillus sp. LMS6]
MYVGRDLSELENIQPSDWTDKELAFFHHGMQQMTAYLNVQGNSKHRAIIEEIENRGGLHHTATWTSGTEVHYD